MVNYIKNNKIGLFFFTLGIVFTCIGIFREENKIVLQKAIMICLECIGIG